MGDYSGTAEEREVVLRIAHATTDVEWAKTFLFSPGAVESGIEAIRRGAPIITDVEMVRSGIRRSAAERTGSPVLCFLNDADVAEEAKRRHTTRARAAMRKALPLLDGAVVAIGNAPTAQPGSALAWGARGQRFESSRPDQNYSRRCCSHLRHRDDYLTQQRAPFRVASFLFAHTLVPL